MRIASCCLCLAAAATSGAIAEAQFTTIIDAPPMAVIPNAVLGSDTQLNVRSGGTVSNFVQAGASDGSSTNVEVNVLGGFVGGGFTANLGSKVNISGGTIGNGFTTYGGDVSMSGGSMGDGVFVANSVFNVTGGTVGNNFAAHSNSVVNLSGGSVGHTFTTYFGSTVNVLGGAVGNDFDALQGSSVCICGGAVGNDFDANSGSHVSISSGSVGNRFEAFNGSKVNITGGIVGDNLIVRGGSSVAISGGSVGKNSSASGPVTISGGTIGDSFFADVGSFVNLYGGSVGADFDAGFGGKVNLFGTQFTVAAADITSTLALNVPLTISQRGVALSGILADGSPFSFDLNSIDAANQDYFSPNATVTVTLVLPGDFDRDGDDDGADFLAWQRGNSPGRQSTGDLSMWKTNFGAVAAISITMLVPEPAATTMTIALVFALLRCRRHSL